MSLNDRIEQDMGYHLRPQFWASWDWVDVTFRIYCGNVELNRTSDDGG